MRQGLDYDISLGPGATVKRSRGDGAVTGGYRQVSNRIRFIIFLLHSSRELAHLPKASRAQLTDIWREKWARLIGSRAVRACAKRVFST